jgi:hypothetical protein
VAAERVARALGVDLMPWQRQVLNVALEVDHDGRLIHRDICFTTPRQSGKSTLLLVLWMTRCLLWPDQRVVYTAQTGLDARKKWSGDWLPLLEASPFAGLLTVHRQSGHERVVFGNGSRQSLVATTVRAGHGDSLDLAILDEAFAHQDGRIEQALRPAMMTRPQPQFWTVSTAGTPDSSPYLLDKVERGREIAGAGVTKGSCYFEWSAPDDADPADPETWRSCMPALGRTVTEAAVQADFESMERHEFERAFLNRWTTQKADPVIPIASWEALYDADSRPVSLVALGVDVSVDRSRACIAIAGKRADGLWHVGVVEYHPGNDWLEAELVRLEREHRPHAIVADSYAPVDGLQRGLTGFASKRLRLTSASEMAEACGVFYDAVTRAEVRHRGPKELVVAIDGAARRTLQDRWAWSRRRSGADISPLVAATLALWGARALKRPAPRCINLQALPDERASRALPAPMQEAVA